MELVVEESQERRRQLVELLLQGCHCAVIIATTLDRAHRIFTVINDRGLDLARGDILKAQMLGSVPPARRDELGAMWKRAERGLGGSLDELLGHIRTIEGRPRRTRIIDEIRGLVAQSGDVEDFLRLTLLPYASILAAVRSVRDGTLPPSIGDPIRYLDWLGSRDWVPPLMLYWRIAEGRPDHLAPFLRRLERLAYGMRLLGIGVDKRAVRWRAVIEAMRSGKLGHPGNPLELTRDEQRLIAFNLRALHARNQLACKLVLLRINDALAGAPQGLDPGAFTVEHVLPQKPARSSQWREWFPDPDERERCTQSLGNLILVPRHRNEAARNLELARKLEIYFEGGIDLPRITRDIEGLTTWRPDDVMKREERLVGVLGTLWDIAPAKAGQGPVEQPAAMHRSIPRPTKARPARRVGSAQ